MSRILPVTMIGALLLLPALAWGEAELPGEENYGNGDGLAVAASSTQAGELQPGEGLSTPASAEPEVRSTPEIDKRRIERQKRVVLQTVDGLKMTYAQAEADIVELARETNGITPLEPAVRERDLLGIMDWYYDYADWLSGEIGEFDADYEDLYAGRMLAGAEWQDRIGMLVQKRKEFLQELIEQTKGYEAEQKRLAVILERRRELEGRFNELVFLLARNEEKLKGLERTSPDRAEHEQKGESLRGEVTIVQQEILSLPTIDKEILKHYAVLIERGRGASDMLSITIAEDEALWEIAGVTELLPARQAGAMRAAYERAIRRYETEISRVARKIDEFDRRRSQVNPAGSLRELDRSAELAEYYLFMKQRYQGELQRLKTLVSDYRYELSEVLAGR